MRPLFPSLYIHCLNLLSRPHVASHVTFTMISGSEVLQSVQGEFEAAKAQMRRCPATVGGSGVSPGSTRGGSHMVAWWNVCGILCGDIRVEDWKRRIYMDLLPLSDLWSFLMGAKHLRPVDCRCTRINYDELRKDFEHMLGRWEPELQMSCWWKSDLPGDHSLLVSTKALNPLGEWSYVKHQWLLIWGYLQCAPPSYKLVYKPQNYSYKYHKP